MPTKEPIVGVACWLADKVRLPLLVWTTASWDTRMLRVVVTVRSLAPKLEVPLKMTAPGLSSSVMLKASP